MATTQITIDIDQSLLHALLMAKCSYLTHECLPTTGRLWRHRIANHDQLQALYTQIEQALYDPPDTAEAEAA